MAKAIFFVIVMMSASALAYAESDSERFGRDDFLSSSISAICDKVGQYTSGEKDVILSDDEMRREETDKYGVDALRGDSSKTTIRSTTSSGPTTK